MPLELWIAKSKIFAKNRFFFNFFSGKFFIPVALNMHRLRGVVAEAQRDAYEVHVSPCYVPWSYVGSRESSSAMSLGLIAGERARQRDAIVTTAFRASWLAFEPLISVACGDVGGRLPTRGLGLPRACYPKPPQLFSIFFGFILFFFFSKK